MIKALHTIIYSDDPEATRAFLRDVLGWPFVEEASAIPPWPVYKTGRSEMAVHPTRGVHEGREYSQPRHHSISLMCDNIEETVATLKERGADFAGEIQDRGFGLAIMLRVPGAGEMVLYQPQHPVAIDL